MTRKAVRSYISFSAPVSIVHKHFQTFCFFRITEIISHFRGQKEISVPAQLVLL